MSAKVSNVILCDRHKSFARWHFAWQVQRFRRVLLCVFPHLSSEGCWILCQLSGLLLLPPPPRIHRTSTASARSQCSPPDPNSKLRIRVIPAGPQLQAVFPAGPELNSKLRIKVIPAGPQLHRSQFSPPDPNSK